MLPCAARCVLFVLHVRLLSPRSADRCSPGLCWRMVGIGALSLRIRDEHLHEEPSLRIVLEAKVMRRVDAFQILPLDSGGQLLKPSREFGGSCGHRPSSGGSSPGDAQRLSLRHKASAACSADRCSPCLCWRMVGIGALPLRMRDEHLHEDAGLRIVFSNARSCALCAVLWFGICFLDLARDREKARGDVFGVLDVWAN